MTATQLAKRTNVTNPYKPNSAQFKQFEAARHHAQACKKHIAQRDWKGNDV